MDKLGLNPSKILKRLFSERPHISKEDSLRFRTKEEFDEHLELLSVKNMEKQRRRQGGRICRPFYWYVSLCRATGRFDIHDSLC